MPRSRRYYLRASGGDFEEGKHPRDDAGKFTSGDAEAVVEQSKVKDKYGGQGFTFDPREHKLLTEGFAVSRFKGQEARLPIGHKLTAKDVERYYNAHQELLKREEGACIGGWYTEDHQWCLDVSHVLHDVHEAAKVARDNDQDAFYDLSKKYGEIKTPDYWKDPAAFGGPKGETRNAVDKHNGIGLSCNHGQQRQRQQAKGAAGVRAEAGGEAGLPSTRGRDERLRGAGAQEGGPAAAQAAARLEGRGQVAKRWADSPFGFGRLR